LGIDRVVPVGNKIISDAELNLYKYKTPVSTRLVAMNRKKAIDRVKMVLVLNKFLEYIRDIGKAGNLEYIIEAVQEMESAYPLKLKRLQFQNWMWPYLVDVMIWRTFLESNPGECKDFSIYAVLDVSKEKYAVVRDQIKQFIKDKS
jgi:uncharacterized protein YeeX (DUF496 family)